MFTKFTRLGLKNEFYDVIIVYKQTPPLNQPINPVLKYSIHDSNNISP